MLMVGDCCQLTRDFRETEKRIPNVPDGGELVALITFVYHTVTAQNVCHLSLTSIQMAAS